VSATREDTTEPSAPRQPHSITPWVWALVLIFLAYPLSIGPAAKLWGAVPPGMVVAFYRPISWLCEKSPAVTKVVDWYLDKVWHLP
jgi:hypothetical protein